jgi:hypothetical protein
MALHSLLQGYFSLYVDRLRHRYAVKHLFKVSLGTNGFEHNLRKILNGGNLIQINDSGAMKLNFK